MFVSKKHTLFKIALTLILIALIAAASAAILYYYPHIHALNSPQNYKGIFI